MTLPGHHPPQADLLSYSSGSASDGVAVLVACHLTFCPRCRKQVGGLDRLAEAMIPSMAPSPRGVPGVEGLLERLGPQEAPRSPARHDEILPAPLRERVGPADALPWQRYPLGMAYAPLQLGGVDAFVVDFPPGLALPDHRHQGIERAMPLVGGFSDGTDAFGPGDVSVDTGDEVHRVRIDEHGHCVCLFVNDGAIVPDHAALRWLGRLTGWL